jgi:NAD(P)H-dependent FMN reductase
MNVISVNLSLNRKDSDMLDLKIIIASTRPGRKGPAVASWIYERAKQNSAFNTKLLDLAEINLPFLDEAAHPRLQKYEKQHTKDWSREIGAADAFIVVTPEYNFSFPATIKNALDFLYLEWNYKPMAFVSYGGLSGGMRSVQLLKQVVTTLKMMPLAEAVNIPMFAKHIDEQGKFNSDEILDKSADTMFAELQKWAEAMKAMRK